MATLWERLFNNRTARQVDQISQQLAEMQATSASLQQQNNLLNSLLSVQFRAQGGFARFDTINQINFIRNGYNISSAIYAIVSDIAQKGASIPLIAYEVIDDTALKNYKASRLQRPTDENLILSKRLKTKALRQVEMDNPIQRLIDQPNPDDNATLFYETSIGFTALCGNNYWYTPRLDMGADKGKVTELRIMPSQFTGLIIVFGFPQKVIGYKLIIDGVRLLKTDEVIHMRYPNYDWTVDGQQLYGLAPLKAAYNTLQRSNSAETSATAMFDNGGPATIVTNKSIPADSYGIEQIGKIKKLNNDEYSGNTNRNKLKWMLGDIAAIPLGLSPVDLNILESEKWSFDMLCNVFHVSSIMFNNHSASTESNVKEMIRDSWVRGVLPLRKMHCDSFNRTIVPAYEEKGRRYFVDMDLSGIQDLQPDKATQATWLNTSFWLSPNEKRKIQDIDESPDPLMNKIWIPSGLTLMDDAVVNVDALPELNETTETDNTTNTGE